ncbi:hypothetical protein FRB94_004106 [Tulasnella sp. JGI-2019a]|nr:hypothetical protein FRB94_004106 [Tulasnella sp. JGI-2019a]
MAPPWLTGNNYHAIPLPMSEYSRTVLSGNQGGHFRNPELLEFQGDDSEDVTLFLRDIARVAFNQGHHQDFPWMIGYTETCLTGTALRWFNELDEDVLRSWKTLRGAFLARFGPQDLNPTILTPAAAPIPNLNTRPTDQDISTPIRPSRTSRGRKVSLITPNLHYATSLHHMRACIP